MGSNGKRGAWDGDGGYVLRGTRSAVMVRGVGWGPGVMYYVGSNGEGMGWALELCTKGDKEIYRCVGSNGEGHGMGDGSYVLCRQ